MTRDKFRNQMESFKKARESNPQLSYWEWKNSLPDNLAHTPDWQYNNFGAYTGGLKPELNEDGYYHLGSRNPYTGEILKPKSHPTYDKAIQNDAAAGYFPYEKNGITYTKTYSPTGDISGYANGTDGIQSNTSEIPVTYSNGKWNYGYNPGAGFLKPVVSIQDAADLTPTNIYPEGHLIEKYKTSDLTSNLSQLKQELQDLNLPYEHIKYDGSGNKSLYSKYRSWDNKLNFKNLLQNYPNYKERPGYSYSIFEHKYPSTTNGAVQYGASEGYNTIHMPNVIDANTGHYENYPIEDLVPLSSNQIKIANSITYDDSGNIIPISKRDNFNSPDIRYGLIPLLGFGLYNKYNKNKENKSN